MEIIYEITKTWPQVIVVSSSAEELPEGTEGLLTIGNSRTRFDDPLLITDSVATKDLSLNQALFQANAKIGRMLSSDSIKRKVMSQAVAKDTGLSRRDLFSGLRRRGVFPTYSDAPSIYNSICESRYGCSKCIQACPTRALTTLNGTLILKDQDCNRVGICAAVCPVSAIQLPTFSESRFLGLVHGITVSSPNVPKTLVLTCNLESVSPGPWMFIEKVKDVGTVGPRQLMMAASSGIDRIIIYCADGRCAGKENAQEAVESLAQFQARTKSDEHQGVVFKFLEGAEGNEEIGKINLQLRNKADTSFIPGDNSWNNYLQGLAGLGSEESVIADGLGLTNLKISDSCTLCDVCSKYCPHSALRIKSGLLEFDSSKCTGCGYCALICPEHSISISSPENFGQVHNRVVFQDRIVNCARCGRPIGSVRYLKRIASLLKMNDPMMKYCDMCKQHIAMEKLLGN